MKRLIVMSISLAAMLALGGYSIWVTNQTCEEISSLLEDAKDAAIAEEYERAMELSEALAVVWEEKTVKLAAFSNHADIDKMTEAISSLRSLILFEEQAEFCANIDTTKMLMEDILEYQIPTLRNLL